MNTAKLIEPGVKYFLDSSLKICNKKKFITIIIYLI